MGNRLVFSDDTLVDEPADGTGSNAISSKAVLSPTIFEPVSQKNLAAHTALAQTLTGTDGNDYLSAPYGSGALTIHAGNGDDTLVGSGGHDLLDGGAGNDLLEYYGSNATLTGGDGIDTFVLSVYANDVVVTDFNDTPTGDKIDLAALLKNTYSTYDWQGGNPFAGGYLRLEQSGADTLLQYDLDGSGGNSSTFQTLLKLLNVDAHTLTAANFLPNMSPDGTSVPGIVLKVDDGGHAVDSTYSSLNGSYFDDTLIGGKGADFLFGFGGNDLLIGGGNNSIPIPGYSKNDVLDGGYGNDTLIAGDDGYDQLNGGPGDDSLVGGAGADTLFSTDGSGNDTMLGGGGNDTITSSSKSGETGSIWVDGGAGDDVIRVDMDTSGHRVLTVTGGEGTDTYVLFSDTQPFNPANFTITDFAAGIGGDRIDVQQLLSSDAYYLSQGPISRDHNPMEAGTGILRIIQSGSDTLLQYDGDGPGNADQFHTIATLKGVLATSLVAENFIGANPVGPHIDGVTIQGTAAAETLEGTQLNDTIDGGGGADSIFGDAGDDLLSAGAHSVDNVYISGGDGNDTLIGGAGDDLLDGGTGNNLLIGGGGNDAFVSGDGAGSDTMQGGAGNDTFSAEWRFGDSTHAVTVVNAGAGDDFITVSFSDTGAQSVEASGGDGIDTYTVNTAWDGSNPSQILLSKQDAHFVITDFAAGPGGDVIDVTRLIQASQMDGFYSGGNPMSPDVGFLRVIQDGNDTLLQYDRDGATGSQYQFHTVMTLQNVLASSLTSNNFTGDYRPDGSAMPGQLIVLSAGANDVSEVHGTSYNDTIIGDAGHEFIYSGPGDDLIDAFAENVFGEEGNDTIIGEGNFVKFLYGGPGNDSIVGGGQDYVDGGAGDDIFRTPAGFFSVDGGTGNDTLIVLGKFADYTVTLYQDQIGLQNSVTGETIFFSSIETIVFTDGAKSSSDFLYGFADGGNNVLTGGSGDDTLDGLGGVDTMTGGAGDDTYVVDNPHDVVVEKANEGNDTVQVAFSAAGTYTLPVNVENATVTATVAVNLVGNASDNVLTGNALANALTGNAGNDTLIGGGGNDTLTGGSGDDVYVVNNAGVTVVEAANGGHDLVQTSLASYTLAANVEDLVYMGSVAFAGTGNALDNAITGGAGDDTLSGGAGNDTFHSGGGHDLVDGGTGTDTVVLTGNFADYTRSRPTDGDTLLVDTLTGDSITLRNVETVVFADGSKTLAQVQENLASNGNDLLKGTSGNDTLDGHAGNDTMIGGAGDDVYIVDAAGDVVTELANGGIDRVETTLAKYTLGANVENLRYTGTAAFTGTGNALDNVIESGAGNDSLSGGAGNDTFRAGKGHDVVDGGDGNDRLVVLGDFADYVRSRPNATDTLLIDAATGESITLRNVETVSFADGDKSLGEVQYNLVSAGNDVLTGTTGNDTINGGAGADTMSGLAGDDVYIVDNVGDVVIEAAGAGIDTVDVAYLVAGTYTLTDNVENATVTAAATIKVNLIGNALDNVLTGNAAANVLTGNDGNDTLIGGAGSDTMVGGNGDDVYVVDAAGDVVTELANGGIDRVETVLAKYTLGANVENLRYTGTAAFTGTGNALDNVIEGGAGNDSLSGGAGNDTFRAGKGHDVVDGGDGNDTLVVLGDFADYVRSRPNATDTLLVDSATGESITLRNVETVSFADGDKSLSEVQYNLVSAGNDVLTGTTGNDTINGGTGADTMSGLAGDDVYIVDNVGDVVIEAAGAGIDTVDVAYLVAGTYTLPDNVENATVTAAATIKVNLVGNALDNVLTGNAAANVLAGNDGNDTLIGGAGSDTMVGGNGDDVYVVDAAGDVVTELANGGIDRVETVLAKYTLGANVENLRYTGTAAFTGTGNALDNVIESGAGNDSLSGGAGNDTFRAGKGHDVVDGGDGNDTLVVLGDFADYVRSRPNATDTLLVDAATGESITLRNIENVSFADGDKSLSEVQYNLASAGNDVLTGTTGNDTINGGTGADTMSGLAGDDVYIVDNVGDVVIEAAGAGIDTVDVAYLVAGTYTLPDNVENATVTAAATIKVNLIGNALDNVLTGNAAANVLTGNDGNDTLIGGAGSDTMVGGPGDDVYVVDAAGDVVTELADGGIDRVETTLASYTLGANVEDLRYKGAAAFTGTGNELDNVIEGGAGNDKLNGAAGDDTLVGGAGNDTLTGGSGADMFVFNSASGVDTITDFLAGTDKVAISQAAFAIGNGDINIDGFTARSAPGGFAASAELVTFSQHMTAMTTANAAAIIGSAATPYAVGDKVLFALTNGSSSVLYLFTSHDHDAVVSAAELTQVAVLTGVQSLSAADIQFVA